MRTLGQLGFEFSHLDFDEDAPGATKEGLILFRGVIQALHAPGSVPKPYIVAAIIRALKDLRPNIERKKFVECEEIFQSVFDKIESTEIYLQNFTIREDITKDVLLRSVFTLQTYLSDS